MMNQKKERRADYWLLMGIAILGILGIVWATSRGIGLNPDSARYIDCAKNISAGKGYVTALQDYYHSDSIQDYVADIERYGEPGVRREIHFPPLYSYSIVLLNFFGLDFIPAAKALSLIFFGANIFLVGYTVLRFTKNNRLFACGASLLMFGSESMLNVHTMALSEPLFIFLSLLGLLLISEYLANDKIIFLLTSAGAFGLAFLTRITGIALIASAIIGLLFFVRKNLYRKMMEAGIFGFISCLPMTLYVIKNFQITGLATSRNPGYIALGLKPLYIALTWISSWIFPGSSRIQVFRAQETVLAILVMIGLSTISLIVLIQRLTRRRTGRSNDSPTEARERPLFYMLHVAAYFGVFFFSAVFVEPKLLTETRLLAPAFVSSLIVLMVFLASVYRQTEKKKRLALLMSAYLIYYAVSGSVWIHYCHLRGRGYSNAEWQSPEIVRSMEILNQRPGPKAILSNDDSAIYFLGGKYAYPFSFEELTERRANSDFGNEIPPVYFVYFRVSAHQRGREFRLAGPFQASGKNLKSEIDFPIDVIADNSHALIFRSGRNP